MRLGDDGEHLFDLLLVRGRTGQRLELGEHVRLDLGSAREDLHDTPLQRRDRRASCGEFPPAAERLLAGSGRLSRPVRLVVAGEAQADDDHGDQHRDRDTPRDEQDPHRPRHY